MGTNNYLSSWSCIDVSAGLLPRLLHVERDAEEREKGFVMSCFLFRLSNCTGKITDDGWLKIKSCSTLGTDGLFNVSKSSIRVMRSRSVGVRTLYFIWLRASVIGCLFRMRQIGSLPNGWSPFKIRNPQMQPRLKRSNDGRMESCLSVEHIHPSVVTSRKCLIHPVASSRTTWRMSKSDNFIVGSFVSPFGEKRRMLEGLELLWTIQSEWSWFNPTVIW